MIRFLPWLRSILLCGDQWHRQDGRVFLILLVVVLVVISLARGDGQPGNMVLALDLREPIADSAAAPDQHPHAPARHGDGCGAGAGCRRPRPARQGRGDAAGQWRAFHRRGPGDRRRHPALPRQGQIRHRPRPPPSSAPGWAIIWPPAPPMKSGCSPKAPSRRRARAEASCSCAARLDKINAQPQIAKRAEYKSAADMFMEKQMSPADREQLTALMNSVYDTAIDQMAANRKVKRADVIAALEASPQFAEEARSRRLIDRMGYDDEARAAAKATAGADAKIGQVYRLCTRSHAAAWASPISPSFRRRAKSATAPPRLPGSTPAAGIASDDLSAAIAQATARQEHQGHRASGGFARRIGHRLRPDPACGEDGAEGRQAGGGQHGRRRGLRRLLHLTQRQQDRGRARHHHRLDRRADRQGQSFARRWA